MEGIGADQRGDSSDFSGSPGQVFCSPEAKVIAIALIYPGQSLLL